MAVGQLSTYSDSVTPKQSLQDIIDLIDPQDVPVLSYLGTANQGRFRMVNFPHPTYGWFHDTLRLRKTAINNLAGYADNATDMLVDDATLFKPGDVILVHAASADEKMWVSAVDYSTHTITVVRGWGTTSAVAITNDDVVEYLFSARLEGDDSDPAYFTTPTVDYNQSQIFHWDVRVSGSEQDAMQRWGITDSKKYQIMKAMGGLGSGRGQKGQAGDLLIDLEKTFFFGEEIIRSNGVAGAMGGFEHFVAPGGPYAVNANGDDLQFSTVLGALEDAWRVGGSPKTIICNMSQKQRINTWLPTVTTERSERTAGVLVQKIETDFGLIDILVDRWCPDDRVYIVQKDYLGWVTLRNWHIKELGDTGDNTKSQIVGEFGFVLKNPQAHRLIYGLAA